MWEKALFDLLDVVKSLVAAQKARGEAVDKRITDRLDRAERTMYEEMKKAHDGGNAAQAELAFAELDKLTAPKAPKLSEDSDAAQLAGTLLDTLDVSTDFYSQDK